MNKNYFIGITGTSGSGKSTVLNILKKQGYFTIDCDIFSIKTILSDKVVIKRIEEIIGSRVCSNNVVNLKQIGDFFDKNNDLECIFESWYQVYLGNKIKEFLLSIEFKGTIFVDIPFLDKKGINDLFDEIWIIETDINFCYERISKRNNYTNFKTKYLLERSMVSTNVYNDARHIIINNDTITDLEVKIKSLLKNIDNVY